MPDFRRVDAMPARDLARTQQVINRRRTSSSVRARVIAKGLAVEAALGMRLQVERRDDLVCRLLLEKKKKQSRSWLQVTAGRRREFAVALDHTSGAEPWVR